MLSLQKLVNLGVGEGGVGAEVAAHLAVLVTRDHGFEHVLPAARRMNIARTQRAAFQISKLVEDEQRMIAGAGEMAVVGRPLLIAVGRADAGIHIKHDALQ